MSHLTDLLNTKLKFASKNGNGGGRGWIIYGWSLTIIISLIILGYTLFFVQQQVFKTIKNVDVIFALKQRVVYNEINYALFEQVNEKWQAKKNLTPPPKDINNPF